MKHIKSLLILLGSLFVGESLSRGLGLPVPGTILGMLVLLVLLFTGLVTAEDVAPSVSVLLANMTIFFIPPAVGIMESYQLIADDLLVYILAIIIPTILTMAVTGLVVKGIMGDEDDQ